MLYGSRITDSLSKFLWPCVESDSERHAEAMRRLHYYVMSTSHESITLTKYSLRRQGRPICRRIKDNIPCDSGRIGVRTMYHTRWKIQIDGLGSIISNCIVLQSMWNYAKDVDRARYGDEGKNSRRFVSYI